MVHTSCMLHTSGVWWGSPNEKPWFEFQPGLHQGRFNVWMWVWCIFFFCLESQLGVPLNWRPKSFAFVSSLCNMSSLVYHLVMVVSHFESYNVVRMTTHQWVLSSLVLAGARLQPTLEYAIFVNDGAEFFELIWLGHVWFVFRHFNSLKSLYCTVRRIIVFTQEKLLTLFALMKHFHLWYFVFSYILE